jgi:predicted metal-binding membrane protein
MPLIGATRGFTHVWACRLIKSKPVISNMSRTQSNIQEKIIIFALVLLSAVAWAATIYYSQGMNSQMSMQMPGMEQQPSLIVGASLFLGMWIVMMVAMMFPAAAPMVVIFSNLHQNRRARNEGFIPTWVFVAGYLLVWTSFGVLAYFIDLVAGHLSMSFPNLHKYGSLMGGAVLIAAGLYQLTPLKNVCLKHCRSPLHFIMHRWREGYLGALTMGMDHGAYCLGCCWGLMLVLFVVGIMNIAWMGILTLVIFVEKISKHGVVISRVVGGLLIILGLVMAIRPAVVPL